MLEVAIRVEGDPAALESELHALAEFTEWDQAPSDVLERVAACRAWSEPWAEEYVGYIRERVKPGG